VRLHLEAVAQQLDAGLGQRLCDHDPDHDGAA
jgi:hypothetical protein